MENKKQSDREKDFKGTDSNKANQLGPSSPYNNSSEHPQSDAASQSADNDMDRQATTHHDMRKDADEAQSDGDLSFPEGK